MEALEQYYEQAAGRADFTDNLTPEARFSVIKDAEVCITWVIGCC